MKTFLQDLNGPIAKGLVQRPSRDRKNNTVPGVAAIWIVTPAEPGIPAQSVVIDNPLRIKSLRDMCNEIIAEVEKPDIVHADATELPRSPVLSTK